MAPRTGRKSPASERTRERAIAIAKSNPGLPAATIAQRLNGVTARQVQYWINKSKSNGSSDGK